MPESSQPANHLTIIAGPSCAGKTPLYRAFKYLFAREAASFKTIIPYTTRRPRPDEQDGTDYHFVDRKKLDSLRKRTQMITLSVRGDRQGVDLEEIQALLEAGHTLYEGNTYLGRELIRYAGMSGIAHLSIFVSPFYLSEIRTFIRQLGKNGARRMISDIMRKKIEKRARRKKYQSAENIDQRVAEVFDELVFAGEFDFVLVNPLGEEDPVWDDPAQLSGSALSVVQTFAEILIHGSSPQAEKWPASPAFINTL